MTQKSSQSESQLPDLVLRAALLDDGRLVDIWVTDGLISAVSPSGQDSAGATEERQLDGSLVIAGFAEPHAHLDKALTADLIPNPAGDLMGAVLAWNEAMAQGWFDYDNIVERSTDALSRLVARGATAVRTHVNVNSRLGTWPAYR